RRTEQSPIGADLRRAHSAGHANLQPSTHLDESQIYLLQRTAGNAAVEQLISGWSVQRVLPTATPTQTAAPGSIQDPSKLRIVPAPSRIEYYEFVRQGNRITFHSSPLQDDPFAKWMLLDPLKSEVETSSAPARYDLFPAVIRKRVEDRGPSSFGLWTLHFQSGPYYDEVS